MLVVLVMACCSYPGAVLLLGLDRLGDRVWIEGDIALWFWRAGGRLGG